MIVGIDASNLRAGGGVTHLVGLLGAARLPCHGVDRVVVWGGRSTLDRLPAPPGVDLRHAPEADGTLPRRLLWQHTGLPRAARGVCDLLFIPGGAGSGGFRPQVTMCRNMLPFEAREAWRFGPSRVFARLMVLRRAQARAFTRADGVIFLSEYAFRTVRAVLPAAPRSAVIVPHGVEERFRARPRSQEPIEGYTTARPFRLLYVSTVSPYKHQVPVAEAVAVLRAEGLAVTASFHGGVDTPRALAEFTAALRRLDPAGTFLSYAGSVPHSELPGRYHQADAFVFASSCENMPNTLLEAMAAGLPIASSDRGPMPEVLGDAGVYFDPERAGSIADALRRLVRDPALRARLAETAYTRAMGYTWTRCAEETFAFLARVGRP